MQGGKPATVQPDGPEAYKRCRTYDVDIVYIATPWELHTRQALDTMRAGKTRFLEVPAAITTAEVLGLDDTRRRRGVHCMMLENVNYGREELMVLNMVRQGLFGELLHGEAAYIHELRGQMNQV